MDGWMDGWLMDKWMKERKDRENKRPCTDHSDCCKDRTVVTTYGRSYYGWQITFICYSVQLAILSCIGREERAGFRRDFSGAGFPSTSSEGDVKTAGVTWMVLGDANTEGKGPVVVNPAPG